MGIGAIDYAINGNIQPSRVVVVDIDEARLAQAKKLLPVELAAEKGIELIYVNTTGMDSPTAMLRALTHDAGFDDVFVYAAVPAVVEMADDLLAEDGCLNFLPALRTVTSKCRLIFITCTTTALTLSGHPVVQRMI